MKKNLKDEYEWLKEVDSCFTAIIKGFRTKHIKNFFRRVKQGADKMVSLNSRVRNILSSRIDNKYKQQTYRLLLLRLNYPKLKEVKFC